MGSKLAFPQGRGLFLHKCNLHVHRQKTFALTSALYSRVIEQLKAMRGPEASHIESESDNSEGYIIL